MMESARSASFWPLLGTVVAIAITTTMDLNGLSLFSALSLLPLMVFFWWRQGLTRTEMGMTWGRLWHYGLAILYPLFVIGLTVMAAQMAGATDGTSINWQKLAKNLMLMGLTGIPMLVLTEEGFFRGWLWASLRRSGRDTVATLIWSSIAFSAWHWTWAFLESGLGLPPLQVPVYLLNAAVMGVGWGLLRWISGSVVVASVSHAVWNAFAYTLFGAGPIEGALGIQQTYLFDVEVGTIGLGLNLLFTVALWKWWQGRSGPAG